MAQLDPLISEFATAQEAQRHDGWVRAKVEAALADTRAPVAHDEAERAVREVIAETRKRRA